MDRGVVVGGMLISISFLLAVLLNRSAMDAAPPKDIGAATGGSTIRATAHSPTIDPPLPARPPVHVGGVALQPPAADDSEIRREECPAKSMEDLVASREQPGNCSS